jgi:hypothetical protein
MTCLGKLAITPLAVRFATTTKTRSSTSAGAPGCANLCRRHARQVKRSAKRQHRRVESTELRGQRTLPGIVMNWFWRFLGAIAWRWWRLR